MSVATSHRSVGHVTRDPATRRRRWILVDAAMAGSFGLVLAAFAPLLDDALGGTVAAHVGVGLFCLAYAAVLLAVAHRGAPRAAVVVVVAANLGWIVASVAAVATDRLDLNSLGAVVAIVQAIAVAGIAAGQLASVWSIADRRPARAS